MKSRARNMQNLTSQAERHSAFLLKASRDNLLDRNQSILLRGCSVQPVKQNSDYYKCALQYKKRKSIWSVFK